MKTKNDSFLILRMPQELKDALIAEAAKKGIKLSELVRAKLNGKASKKG